MSPLLTAALDKKAVLAAVIIGLIAIGGAWFSQLVGGLSPCELCLDQRLPYYWGLPLLVLVLALWNRMPLAVWYLAMGLAVVIFAWSAYLAGYHAGVEMGWWPGPTSCTGTGVEMNFSDLNNINAAKAVPCDKVQFRFLGLTLAGYNMLASVVMVGLLLLAIANQISRNRLKRARA